MYRGGGGDWAPQDLRMKFLKIEKCMHVSDEGIKHPKIRG